MLYEKYLFLSGHEYIDFAQIFFFSTYFIFVLLLLLLKIIVWYKTSNNCNFYDQASQLQEIRYSIAARVK